MDSKIIDVGRLNKREISYYNFKKKNRINYYFHDTNLRVFIYEEFRVFFYY